ncbi:MAG: hypothetical protein ACYTDT_00855 [Planctomycetota bacterium]|jgi:hypothetical protein
MKSKGAYIAAAILFGLIASVYIIAGDFGCSPLPEGIESIPTDIRVEIVSVIDDLEVESGDDAESKEYLDARSFLEESIQNPEALEVIVEYFVDERETHALQSLAIPGGPPLRTQSIGSALVFMVIIQVVERGNTKLYTETEYLKETNRLIEWIRSHEFDLDRMRTTYKNDIGKSD